MSDQQDIVGCTHLDPTTEDYELITRIVDRMEAHSLQSGLGPIDRVRLAMDLTATHLNGCPLRLADFLKADEFNFIHDVVGISSHIDRLTGKLQRCFLPRFADTRLKAGE